MVELYNKNKGDRSPLPDVDEATLASVNQSMFSPEDGKYRRFHCRPRKTLRYKHGVQSLSFHSTLICYNFEALVLRSAQKLKNNRPFKSVYCYCSIPPE